MEFPEGLKYSKEHEWVKEDVDAITIGITDFAQDSLGDIVYLELPEDGGTVVKDESFGVVESVKAVSELYSPISGTIIEVHDGIVDSPEVINDEPYGEAWLIKVEPSDVSELGELLTAAEYKKYVEEEK